MSNENTDRIQALAVSVLDGSVRWDGVQELARLARDAVGELDRLRRECDEVVKRAADAILAPCDHCGHSVGGRLRRALTPLPSETVADAAERVAKERDEARNDLEKCRKELATVVRDRDTYKADAELWRSTTSTLPLTPEALGKAAYGSRICQWEYAGNSLQSDCITKATAVARAVMAALSSEAAADAAWDDTTDYNDAADWWPALLNTAATAALALPEEPKAEAVDRCEVCDWPLAPTSEAGCSAGNCSYRPREGTDEHKRIANRRAEIAARKAPESPQQPEAQPLEWSPWNYPARHESVLRRNVEALDARLRKLEGSR